MHDRERNGSGEGVEEQRSTEATSHREDDRQHNDKTSVEEDGETHHERGDGESQRRTLLTEATDERVGEHLRSTTHFEHPPEHRAQTDQQCNAGKRATEARSEGRNYLVRRNTCSHGSHEADDDQGEERVNAAHDDQQQQERYGSRSEKEKAPRGQLPEQLEIGHHCPYFSSAAQPT